jgi:hypothetical protein
MRLFTVHVVMQVEDIWFEQCEPYGVSKRRYSYMVHSTLFAATDPEEAYAKALRLAYDSDANCDGELDRTNLREIGIQDLEEIDLTGESLEACVQQEYGLCVGSINWDGRKPKVRKREELTLFRAGL